MNHPLPPALSPYSFHLPVFERKESGWFLTHADPQLNWFMDMYSALYVREDYRDILASILEWAFRPLATNELQTIPPVSPLTTKMDEMKLDDINIKVEEIQTTVPLSRKALLYFEDGPFSEESAVMNRVVVTGLPGIGKSGFARYVLILRCMQGLPTVFIYQESELEFYHGGKRFVYPVASHVISNLPPNTWIIVDSVVVPFFATIAKVFVMQVMSPLEDHARWIKKTLPMPVVVAMKPWSAEELIAARSVQLRHFVELYGGSALEAYACAIEPNLHSDQLQGALDNFTATNMRKTLGNQTIPRFLEGGISHVILSLFPQVIEGIRGITLAPPTSHVQDKLMKHVSSLEEQQRNELWRVLLGHSYGKSLAGSIFARNYHCILLKNGPVWPLHAMERRPVRGSSQVNYHVHRKSLGDKPVAWLSLQDELSLHNRGVRPPQAGRGEMRVTEFKAKELGPPLSLQTYYRPLSKISPPFNSFVLTEPRKAVVFQAIVDNALLGFEDLKALGIDEIIYVAVTHTDDIDLALPPVLDVNKYPNITDYYLLTLPRIYQDAKAGPAAERWEACSSVQIESDRDGAQ
ncbi:hypothetical protein FB451DRAFT_1362417 [Mycena latifolia]|nr:hypothetical protein FB451DRAFT_1362417 [Mycena latifolia]